MTRTFAEKQLREMGWFPENNRPPQELLEKIEKARVGEARGALQGNALNEWIKKWIEDNLDEAQRKKSSAFANDRLRRGGNAVEVDLLDKLTEIRNKKFETKELFDLWPSESRIPDAVKQEVVRRVPTTEDLARDIVVCLNAADGKTLWKKEYSGRLHGNGSSGTPCIAGGRCYALGADGTVYCLDAGSGQEVWKANSGTDQWNGRSCSPIVLDGLVIVPTGPLIALDATNGQVKWTQKKIGFSHSSPVMWKRDERTYALCSSKTNVFCVDAQNGQIAWEAPGCGVSTPVVQNDTMLVFDGGLIAYRLAPERVERLWAITNVSDRGASPLLYKGHAYAVSDLGRGFGAICVNLDTGNELWRAKPGTRDISSPVLADGKILAFTGNGLVMFKADPPSSNVLAKAKFNVLVCSSPAIFDGKLLVRGGDAVHCYDVSRKAVPTP